MSDSNDEEKTANTEEEQREHQKIPSIEEEAVRNVVHIKLGWRSWLVVAVCAFANMGQIFVVAGAGSVIAFIVRDLGGSPLSGWIIQGPLLMQSVLSPVLGRLSDVLDRKYVATIPPLIALVGAVISARAASMSDLAGGSILIGATLCTVSVIHAIPSEILPLKYRALANGILGVAASCSGLMAYLSTGALTALAPDGWRNIFWMQAGFHGLTTVGLFLFYWPPKNTLYTHMKLKDYFWACDPIGSFFFISSTTLILLALNWAGGAYHWSDPHVAAPLSVGLAMLVCFGVYEWKGRSDGLIAHIFFKQNANFAYSTFAFVVEGWVFYSAVNSVIPQIVLHLDFAPDSFKIAVRQLSFHLPFMATVVLVTWYATHFKDLQTPLMVTFTSFFAVCICYTLIKPSWERIQLVINVFAGIGQGGPLALLPVAVQLTAPHAYLSTATGLSYSARAIGGAFGSAALNAIINGRLTGHYAANVGGAALAAGLPLSSVDAIAKAADDGQLYKTTIPGATAEILAAANEASKEEYAQAYRLAWVSVIPFVVLAIVAVWLLKSVKNIMTDKVEATVERVRSDEAKKAEEAS
ncbi:MFS general substrate transporter [Durotheca rogersii]|uniref:MFS general substrate transporter n=1 Tax=Durotheca rogersii TaxID=419775 RepID=UPI00221F8AAD|nr:MFS general substrate transporter [Durotheca rogersii]KAI5861128.1 MFS general substrate transporter [Durotheca rogersii]